ncbi:MAG: serine/threonine-protein kinase, partial [Myxococcota bacterium]
MRTRASRLLARMDRALPSLRLDGALRVEELIGEGGMGSVFRAVDERLERSVAVKFLHPGEDGLIERARREAKALARLSHPAIVQVHDVGEHNGQPYLVMEFVDGTPLSDRAPMEVPKALGVVRAVADALGHAHSRGVV